MSHPTRRSGAPPPFDERPAPEISYRQATDQRHGSAPADDSALGADNLDVLAIAYRASGPLTDIAHRVYGPLPLLDLPTVWCSHHTLDQQREAAA